MNLFELQGYAYLVVLVTVLAVKGFALVSAVRFPTQAYPAASRGTKVGWCIGLGLGFVVQVLMLGLTDIVSLAFLIAALVFLADTRPALAEVTSPR